MNKSATCLFVPLCLTFCGPLAMTATAHAAPFRCQTEKATVISDGQVADFDTFLQIIAQRTGSAFLVEDVPLHCRLNPQQRQRLGSLLKNTQDVSEQVTTVAALYDFDVVQVSDRLSVLRKRYTDPNDLPNITFEEAYRSICDLQKLFDAFDPHVSDPKHEGIYHKDVLAALNPEQRQQVLSERGLPVTALSPEQRALCWRSIAGMSTEFDRMFIAGTVFMDETFRQGKMKFGYQMAPGKEPEAKDIGAFYLNNGQSTLTFQPLENQAEWVPPGDADDPVTGHLTRRILPVSRLLERWSLLPASAVGSGNGATPPRVRYDCMPEFAAKNVLWVGPDPATQEEAAYAVEALTQLFDWQLKEMPETADSAALHQKVVHLQAVSYNPRLPLSDMAATIRQLLPGPLRRAMLLTEQRQVREKEKLLYASYKPTPEWEAGRRKQEEEKKRFAARGGDVGRGAARYLRDALHAKLKATPPAEQAARRIAAHDLTPRERTAFGIMQLSHELEDWNSTYLKVNLPNLADFEKHNLIAQIYAAPDGTKRLTLGLAGIYNGSFNWLVATSNIPWEP